MPLMDVVIAIVHVPSYCCAHGRATAALRGRERLLRGEHAMMPRLLVLIACSLIVLAAAGLSATEFHVKTTGKANGDGSLGNPWDLATALNKTATVHPGDTIWVHGGTYTGTFSSYLTGTAGSPIIVRAAIGERATIDNGSTASASITAKAPYTWFWGLELMSSDQVRVSAQTGSFPTDIYRGDAFDCGSNSTGTKMLNLVCHDGFNGITCFSAAPDAEIYGCVIYNNGWDAPDRGHGHAIYTQNETGTKKIYDNIFFNQFGGGMQVYGSSAVHLDNYDIEGNMAFNQGSLESISTANYADNYLYGGGNVAENGIFKDNCSYYDTSDGIRGAYEEIGFLSGVDGLTMTGNYFGDGYRAYDFMFTFLGTNSTVTGNTFYIRCASDFMTGYPSNTFLTSRPSGMHIVVRPNVYEAGRANIYIYNWDNHDGVSVDLSGVLNAGDIFELRDVQNFYGAPAVTGTFTGAAVSVPMTLTAIAQPVGNAPRAAIHTPKEFQVFVLLGKGNTPPAVTSPTTTAGTVGQAFSYQIAASNIPTSYGATNLPSWASVNTSTGAITGTPDAAGSTNVTISATNGAGTGSATLTINVTLPPPPVITSATTASGYVGQAFSYTITATNSPTSFSGSGLPSWASVNTSTGAITGTPTTVGTTSVTISATNAGGTGSATLIITVNLPLPPVITSASTASGYVGQAFSYNITATNNPKSFGASGLPSWASVNTSTGAITGTPTTVGTTSVTINATNAGGTGSATLTITVNLPPPPVITSASTASGYVGQAFSYNVTATNNPKSFGASGLPSWASVNTSTGAITGTPTTAGTTSVAISATNADGTGSATLTITISTPLTIATLAGLAGSSGSADGTRSAARFYNPEGVAVDGSGNVYVGDTSNNTIRKITPSGVSSTLAGLAGSPGSTDGTGSAARFYHPYGVAVDGSGNIYVADSYNNTIRKITPIGIVSTLAGLAGSAGSTDGTGSAARFYRPSGVAVDISGNVYVADSSNSTIRKVTSAGVVSTLAGLAGSTGSADGTGSAARFYQPRGVAVGGSGNLYVGDTSNHTIRRITPAGVVSTLAGLAGSSGSADGTGSAAGFYQPRGVAVDGSENIYVADVYNHTIRMITPSGVVGTPAGLAGTSGSADGTGSAARFNRPYGVAVDSSGHVYVADTNNYTIRSSVTPPVITSPATANGILGMPFSYTITATNLPTSYSASPLPAGLSANTSTGAITGTPTTSGTTSVTISATNAGGTGSATLTITIVPPPPVIASATTASGVVGTTFSYQITATNSPSSFNAAPLPAGLSVNTSTGTITGTPTTSGTTSVTISATNAGGTGSATLTITVTIQPPPAITSATTANGNVGLAFSYNITATNSPTSFNASGLPSWASVNTSTGAITGTPTTAGTTSVTIGATNAGGTGSATLTIVIDAPLTITTLTGLAGSSGSEDGTGSAARFYYPRGVSVGSDGNVYAADTYNHTIRKIALGGVVSMLAGLAGSSGSADGQGSAARFWSPSGVAVDGSGNVYVADTNNHTIREITPSGVVSTLAGLAGSAGSTDGTGSAARFNNPTGVAVDPSGNVYVADGGNNTIRKVTPAGVVSTLAGSAGSTGSADGTGSAAQFYEPRGVAVDGSGNLYVGDCSNCTIRKITPAGVVSTLAGLAGTSGSDDGTGSAARFKNPRLVAVDGSGNVYVADLGNQTIRMITPGGVVSTPAGLAGTFGSADGTGRAARFNNPYGVAVDSSGHVYVADTYNSTIRSSLLSAPVITSPSIANGTVGLALSYNITATSNPTSYNATNLPSWASVDANTGAITGTPTTAGTTSVTISATNAGGTGSATLTITVTIQPPPVITSATTASGVVGTAFIYQITATNGPTSYDATNLPSWATVDTSTGAITGTPNATGSTNVTISATNQYGGGSATLTINVLPALLTVTAADKSKVYGALNPALSYTYTGLVNGDTSATFTGALATTATTGSGVGTYTITQGTLAATGNYTIGTFSAATLTVTPAALTITAHGQDKIYDGTAAATVTLSDNRVAGDTLTLGYTSAAFNDKNVDTYTYKAVSVTGISLGGTDAGNYTFNATASTTAIITPAALAITAHGQGKVYDGTTAATLTLSDNRVAGDALTLNYTSAAFNDKNVGTYKAVSVTGITLTGTDAGNYTFNATASTTASITPGELTVSGIGASNKVYDGLTSATLTGTPGTLAGVVSGDTVLLSGTGVGSFADKNVGNGKTVTVSGQSLSGAQAGNYTLTQPMASADITVKDLTVTATGQNKVYDGTAAATVTLSDNRVAGDTLTTSYATAAFADPNVGTGKTVTVNGISISGPDSGNCSFNTTTTTTADITPASSVSFDLASSSGSEKTANPSIAVSLSTAATQTVTVDYAVTGGTAVSGTNWTLPSGTLTFSPAETTKNLPITILDDGVCTPDLTVQITLSNPSNAVLGATTVHTYTIVDGDLAITARETQDTKGNGYIGAVRMVANASLNGNFAGLQVAVAGYNVAGYSTGADDHEFLVLLTESGTHDTGATPGVKVVAPGNLGLGIVGSSETLSVDATPVTSTDKAKPVLVKAWASQSAGGLEAGDKVYLQFSEAVTSNIALVADFALPVAWDTYGAGATVATGQNGTDPTLVVITLGTNPQLTPGGLYSPGQLAASSPTGIYVEDGTRIADAAANTALNQGVGAAVDLAPGLGSEVVSICWADNPGDTQARSWSVGIAAPGATNVYSTVEANGLGVRNNGNVREKFTASCTRVSSPSGWTLASSAATDQFEVKADNSGAPWGNYTLDFATGPKDIAVQKYSGQSQSFDLQFRLPTKLTTGGGIQQTVQVTIAATQD